MEDIQNNEKAIGVIQDDKLIAQLIITKETTIKDLLRSGKEMINLNKFNVYISLGNDQEISSDVLNNPIYQNISPFDQLTANSYLVYTDLSISDQDDSRQVASYKSGGVDMIITRHADGEMDRNGNPIEFTKTGRKYVVLPYSYRKQYLCKVDDCYKNAVEKGWCKAHVE